LPAAFVPWVYIPFDPFHAKKIFSNERYDKKTLPPWIIHLPSQMIWGRRVKRVCFLKLTGWQAVNETRPAL
jgi:hypothetical protein